MKIPCISSNIAFGKASKNRGFESISAKEFYGSNLPTNTDSVSNSDAFVLSQAEPILAKVDDFVKKHPEYADKSDDIIQDLLLLAIKCSKTHKKEYSKRENKYFDTLINAKSNPQPESLENLEEEQDPKSIEEYVEDEEAIRIIMNNLDCLTPLQKEVILKNSAIYYTASPLSIREIGKQKNCSPQNISKVLQNGRKRLKALQKKLKF